MSPAYPFSVQYDYDPNGTVQRTPPRDAAITALSGPINDEMTYDAINQMCAANYSYCTTGWNATRRE